MLCCIPSVDINQQTNKNKRKQDSEKRSEYLSNFLLVKKNELNNKKEERDGLVRIQCSLDGI